ncbi:UbiX family flavin prenyltransferase [Candidatus Allofournierella excrementavium]|uniref:UbiX family flavin prenyltransferase n=1 Tax=Candidatus Allofournierella excrementavium TaxID=2838591 RepID=UPI003AF8CAA4
MNRDTIVVGASGASGMPLLIQCLKLIRAAGQSSVLIMSDSAVLTLRQETGSTPEDLAPLVDAVYGPGEVGAPPASGSWPAAGMLVVPCSMKTAAGICAGYADNLLLRAADVTIKEHRPLVLAARETPMSAIHLRNLHELAMLPTVRIIPPMLTFYHKPGTIDEMVYHIAAKLVEPFGVEAKEYRRWQGL